MLERDVLAGSGSLDQGEAQGVGAVLGHQFERIDGVAERLGHLAAVLGADQPVDHHVGDTGSPSMKWMPILIILATQK